MSSVKVQIYLPDGSKAPQLNATKPQTPIADLLTTIGFKPDYAYVVFTGPPSYDYGTPLINLNLTLADYNMWHIDVNYIAEFAIYSKADTDKYNVDRYVTYQNNTPTVE